MGLAWRSRVCPPCAQGRGSAGALPSTRRPGNFVSQYNIRLMQWQAQQSGSSALPSALGSATQSASRILPVAQLRGPVPAQATTSTSEVAATKASKVRQRLCAWKEFALVVSVWSTGGVRLGQCHMYDQDLDLNDACYAHVVVIY